MDKSTLLELLRDLDTIYLLEVLELDDDVPLLLDALYDYVEMHMEMITDNLLGEDIYG